MIAAIILGTALPTTPAYIMLAALLIPALIKLGVPPLAAHMFAFYFGCLSAVTPPGVPGRLRGGVHQPLQRVGGGLAGDEVRRGRLPRAVLLRLLPGPPVPGPVDGDRAWRC